ncbi:transcription factor S-II, central domain-containing protein [Scenedesmus sp. NREL 46B-D3]|nr:transcription factor S-II, central domain-containing protein [Scenedesmus sp. NREL 46B-D3]
MHPYAKIAAAAAAAVQSWKECVKRQAQEAGSSQLELSSQPSFGTTTSSGAISGGSGQRQQQQQEQPAAGKSSGSGKASGPLRPPPKTGDGKRDRIRQLLCDGLCLVPDDQRSGQDPGEVAAEVEAAIYARFNQHTGPEYGAKVRSLSFNLKDPANPDLRARVLQGQVDPQELVDMPPEELASDSKRRENHKIRQEAAAEAVRGQTQQASTDMFKCGRCKQKKCTYYQMQTRSADEPMTTFVTCVNCGQKWKFC